VVKRIWQLSSVTVSAGDRDITVVHDPPITIRGHDINPPAADRSAERLERHRCQRTLLPRSAMLP